MNFKSKFPIFFLLFPTISLAAPDPTLTTQLDTLLSSLSSTGTTYVARVLDASTGQELYSHNPDLPVPPASNAKLPNIAAALDHFGPDHKLFTYLAQDSDDLWLIGTGDPSPGDRRLELARHLPRLAILDQFADALLAHHITHVKGKLLIDDSLFDDQRVGPTWPKSELTDYWCAPLTALTLNDSCIEITPTPNHLQILPITTNVKVLDQTTTTGQPAELSITRAESSDTFTVTGLITKPQGPELKAVTDPGLFFADALRTQLLSKGITIDGPTERAPRPLANQKWSDLRDHDHRDDRVIATYQTTLSDILPRIGKQSQNLFADALCKLQGRSWDLAHHSDQPANWPAGGAAIHDFLKHLHIDDSHYTLVDGSGMSPDNRLTARLLTDLLFKMQSHPHFQTFLNSLSISATDGTLDDRLMDLKGQVHGKSGTIDGVKALSGYLTSPNHPTLIFSFIYNHVPDKELHHAQNLLDDACRLLATPPDFSVRNP